MKKKPIRHSAIYTVALPNVLRILRTDAIIYVTPENARQFLDNLDNGEPFELSDGTPTTVVDVPCLVSIELTAEEVQRLKTDIEYELMPRPGTPTDSFSTAVGTRAVRLPAGSTFKEKSMRTRSKLTWNERLKCWQVLQSGVKYMISTRQLQAPATMAGSVTQATEWWAAMQTELERQTQDCRKDEESQK